jgi:hypothetical protein
MHTGNDTLPDRCFPPPLHRSRFGPGASGPVVRREYLGVQPTQPAPSGLYVRTR